MLAMTSLVATILLSACNTADGGDTPLDPAVTHLAVVFDQRGSF